MDLVHELIRKRKSGRVFDPNRQVEEEKLFSLLEAARWAPSCANNQAWRFIVSQKVSLEKVKACLSRGNAWAQHAPLILSVVSRPDLGCQRTGRDYFTLDLGLTIENILLQGIYMGLVIHPIAGFDEEEVKIVLDIPDDYRVYALIIVGYPGILKDMDERTLEKEKAPRARKSLDEIVYMEKWRSIE